MTVGEAAKKMGVTVRTLQYYDRTGVLAPSAESEGGRRLYSDKDLIKLHQILSLKSLGFSLEDIKSRLVSLDTPQQVADVLSEQAREIGKRIDQLSESLNEITLLRKEVLQMHSVDFKKYADIIVNLRMKNDYYFLIKKFDEGMLDHIRTRFDKKSGLDFINRFNRISDEILELRQNHVPPGSKQCQELTERYWNLITEFTGGDMSMLPKLIEFGNFKNVSNDWENKQKMIGEYIGTALEIYFSRLGKDPFGEAADE